MGVPKIHRVTANGLELNVAEWGSEKSDPVLLVHGAKVQLWTWAPIAEALSRDHRVIALDLRGHGESDWANDGYPVEAFVSDIVEVIGSLGIAPADVVGHSLGARISIALAAEHPELVRRLILSDTGPEMASTAARVNQSLLGSGEERRGFNSREELVKYYEAQHPEWRDEFIQLHADHQVRRNWAGKLVFRADPELFWLAGSAGKQETPYLWDAMSRITAPTMLMWGRTSPFMSQEIVNRMIEKIPTIVVQRPETGHYIPREDPEGFVSSVETFLVRPESSLVRDQE